MVYSDSCNILVFILPPLLENGAARIHAYHAGWHFPRWQSALAKKYGCRQSLLEALGLVGNDHLFTPHSEVSRLLVNPSKLGQKW